MRYGLLIISFLLIGCFTSKQVEQGASIFPNNIEAVIIDSGGSIGPCEPTIDINPLDPDNLIAGSVLDRVHVSNDGGRSWESTQLKSSHGVYGDPVIRISPSGVIYYSHLSNPTGRAYRDEAFLDRIVIQSSNNKGRSWSDGSFTKPNSPKDQDKQWMAIDPVNENVYLSWTEFDLYNSENPDHKSRIVFSKSIDEGKTWSDPVIISNQEGDCLDDDQTTEGAVPSVGPNGEIYIAWSYDEKIYFNKSVDQGKSWLKKDIKVADQPEGWSIDIPGLMRCNGMPVTAVDRSQGPNRGTIYVNWADQRNGKDNTDIWLSHSKDGGLSWSTPIRVNNDDTERHQFLSWMDIDQSNGYLYFIFYDRRAHSDNTTDVYLAYSKDGGLSFENIRINEESFIPLPFEFFGDYNDISVYKGRVRPIWTEYHNGVFSIWTALIN